VIAVNEASVVNEDPPDLLDLKVLLDPKDHGVFREPKDLQAHLG
jgi:hypothetical protein